MDRSLCYATHKGAGEIDIAEVELQDLFEDPFRWTGILHEPLLDRVAGG